MKLYGPVILCMIIFYPGCLFVTSHVYVNCSYKLCSWEGRFYNCFKYFIGALSWLKCLKGYFNRQRCRKFLIELLYDGAYDKSYGLFSLISLVDCLQIIVILVDTLNTSLWKDWLKSRRWLNIFWKRLGFLILMHGWTCHSWWFCQ